MSKGFELYTESAQKGKYSVRISRTYIYFSSSFVSKYAPSRWIQIYIDRERQLIAIKHAEASQEHARRIPERGALAAKSLVDTMRSFGYSDSERISTELNDDGLVVFLNRSK